MRLQSPRSARAWTPGRPGTVLLACVLGAAGPAAAIPPEPPFSFEVNTLPNQYLVQGVNDPASVHYMHPLKLVAAAFALDSGLPPQPGVPPGYHVGYANGGFLAPYFSAGTRFVQFYDCKIENNPDDFGCDNGLATVGRILMPTTVYRDRSAACIRGILGHELFHHVEYRYADNGGESGCSGVWGKTTCEGQARALQDKIYLDLDLDPEASCVAPYLGEINSYLGSPNQPLWSASYKAALWWTYLMEQYGTVSGEPQRGIDFLVAWWMDAEDTIDHPNRLHDHRPHDRPHRARGQRGQRLPQLHHRQRGQGLRPIGRLRDLPQPLFLSRRGPGPGRGQRAGLRRGAVFRRRTPGAQRRLAPDLLHGGGLWRVLCALERVELPGRLDPALRGRTEAGARRQRTRLCSRPRRDDLACWRRAAIRRDRP